MVDPNTYEVEVESPRMIEPNTYEVEVESPRLTLVVCDMTISQFRQLMNMDRASEIEYFLSDVLQGVTVWYPNDMTSHYTKDELESWFDTEPWHTLTAMHDAWSNHLSTFQ